LRIGSGQASLSLQVPMCNWIQRSFSEGPLVPSEQVREESGVKAPSTLHVVGAPFSFGQPLDGVDLGPKLIRERGLRGAVTELGWRFVDKGDIKVYSPARGDAAGAGGRNSTSVGRTSHSVAKAVRDSAKDGAFVLTLGGDHSIGMGTLAGVLAARPDAGVIWVDAHADINTPQASPSGNMHGMPVAFAMRLADPNSMPGVEWMAEGEESKEWDKEEWGAVMRESAVRAAEAAEARGDAKAAAVAHKAAASSSRVPDPLLPMITKLGKWPALHPSRIVYIGLNDVDDHERHVIPHLGIRAYTMKDVDRLGIGEVMKRAVGHLTSDGATPRPLHLSFDIDACDPSVAPSTGTRVEGGLSYREAHYVCESLFETGLLGSMDMVEVNPQLAESEEEGERTADAAVELIGSALGRNILPSMSDVHLELPPLPVMEEGRS